MSREQQVKKQLKENKTIYDVSNEEVAKLVIRLSVLEVLIADMEEKLNKEDIVIVTENYGQSFAKANPILKEYRETIKTYQNVIKQVSEIAPKIQETAEDEFDKFNE